MNLRHEIRQLLEKIGPGWMNSTAYDTAWIARLDGQGGEMSERALEWLRENQLSDGSWGASNPRYHHDRLVCTLSAAIALAKQGNSRDRMRLDRALLGLDTALNGLTSDICGETIGFELIIPTLLEEAREVGLIWHQVGGCLDDSRLRYPDTGEKDKRQRSENPYLEGIAINRELKLSRLPGGMINRQVTVAFSSEMVGHDGAMLFDIDNLQEDNGSVGHSPAATAFFALHIRPEDSAALKYLHQVSTMDDNGGVPDVAPFDSFERAWTLWNLHQAAPLDEDLNTLCEPHLNFLRNAWVPFEGIGFAAGYSVRDSDVSSMAYEVLSRFGQPVDIEAVLSYEAENYFLCLPLEANPSISANIHVLGALNQAGFPAEHPSVKKVLDFLQERRFLDIYWLDKWHISPYYPTSHAVIALAGYVKFLAENAVEWILETQNRDGSWGFYSPTAEETAYSLQALFAWQQVGGRVPKEALKRGLGWLSENMAPPYPPLWIGKCLYVPSMVVRSVILSVMMVGEKEALL